MTERERFQEALDHMNHVVEQRQKNAPDDHLDVRLVGPGLSVILLETKDLRLLLERTLARLH